MTANGIDCVLLGLKPSVKSRTPTPKSPLCDRAPQTAIYNKNNLRHSAIHHSVRFSPDEGNYLKDSIVYRNSAPMSKSPSPQRRSPRLLREDEPWFIQSPHVDQSSASLAKAAATATDSLPLSSNDVQRLRAVYELSERFNKARYSDYEQPLEMPTPIDRDPVARKYFPVTLGQTYQVKAQMNSLVSVPRTPTFSPPSIGIPQPPVYRPPWRPETPHNRAELEQIASWRPTAALLPERTSLEIMLNDIAPATASSGVFLTSPYNVDLARVRLDRLRLEEEILAEIKRQEEMERIRGPQPKWYELKTPQFHYEAQKNNDLLQNVGDWQDLLHYREQLERKSQDFLQTHSSDYQKSKYLPVSGQLEMNLV